jgi:hypothetical protein
VLPSKANSLRVLAIGSRAEPTSNSPKNLKGISSSNVSLNYNCKEIIPVVYLDS